MIEIHEAIILAVLYPYEMPFNVMEEYTLQALRK
jgi:hypothetical protein